ncbi:hypothetical protein ACFC5Z_08040 [Streptomyces sp. NPDC056004]|uniref:hypothetical protein n=1 Tax=unclassified Streptomyces TaxID=2593676 RepID=UPI0035E1A3A2
MKALVIQGPGRIAWQDAPDPVVQDAAGRLTSSSLFTHRLERAQMEEAHDVISRALDTGALKVVLGGSQHNEIIAPVQP